MSRLFCVRNRAVMTVMLGMSLWVTVGCKEAAEFEYSAGGGRVETNNRQLAAALEDEPAYLAPSTDPSVYTSNRDMEDRILHVVVDEDHGDEVQFVLTVHEDYYVINKAGNVSYPADETRGDVPLTWNRQGESPIQGYDNVFEATVGVSKTRSVDRTYTILITYNEKPKFQGELTHSVGVSHTTAVPLIPEQTFVEPLSAQDTVARIHIEGDSACTLDVVDDDVLLRYSSAIDDEATPDTCSVVLCGWPESACEETVFTFDRQEGWHIQPLPSSQGMGDYESWLFQANYTTFYLKALEEDITIQSISVEKVSSTDDQEYEIVGSNDANRLTFTPDHRDAYGEYRFRVTAYPEPDFEGEPSKVAAFVVVVNDPPTFMNSYTRQVAVNTADIISPFTPRVHMTLPDASPGVYGQLDPSVLWLFDENDELVHEDVRTTFGVCSIINGSIVRYTPDNNPANVGQVDHCTIFVCEVEDPDACARGTYDFELLDYGRPTEDHLYTTQDQTLVILKHDPDGLTGLLDNDGLVDGNSFGWDGERDPNDPDVILTDEGGTITKNPDGEGYLYTPPQGFVGVDQVKYGICYDVPPSTLCGNTVIVHLHVEDVQDDGYVSISRVVQDDPYDAQPRVIGTSDAVALLTIFIDDVQVGESTANAEGDWRWSPDEALAPGTYVVRVVHTNGSNDEILVIVAEPDEDDDVIVVTPPDDQAPTPVISGKAKPNTTVTVTIDGRDVGSVGVDNDGNWEWTPSVPMEPGEYTVVIRGADGRATEVTVTVRGHVQGDAQVSIERPYDGATTAQRRPHVVGQAEATDRVDVYLDYFWVTTIDVQDDSTWRWFPDSALEIGSHRIRVMGEHGGSDVVELHIESSSAYSGDVTILTPNDDEAVNGEELVVSGKATANTTVLLYIDDSPQEVVKVDEGGDWMWKPHVDLSEQMHHVVAIGDNGSIDEVSFHVYYELSSSGCYAMSTASATRGGAGGMGLLAVWMMLMLLRYKRRTA